MHTRRSLISNYYNSGIIVKSVWHYCGIQSYINDSLKPYLDNAAEILYVQQDGTNENVRFGGRHIVFGDGRRRMSSAIAGIFSKCISGFGLNFIGAWR